MKKIIIFCLTLLLSVPVFAKDITIMLDNNEIKSDVSAYIKDDRTFVPIRFISEKLGYDVTWDENLRMVTISDSKTKIQLVIDSRDIVVNGNQSKMDTAPTITNDRTFVPLRFVAEYMGLGVDWDANTYTVMLKTLNSQSNSKSEYTTQMESLLKTLKAKTEELKSYFYAGESKYSRAEIENKFNILKSDIDNINRDINSLKVPAENITSHRLIVEATNLINEALNEYNIGILDGNSDHAKKLVEIQTKLAVKLHEISNALKAENEGKIYSPDLDTQIFNRAGEIEKNKNPLDDELIQNLLKKI